jgi:hypothetical protein
MTIIEHETVALVPHQTEIELAEHAAVIRALGKRMISDVLEIARRLKDAKRLAGHGGWLPWLDREFGWSEDTAERFMSLNRLQGQIPQIAEYDLPVSGLYMLAAPNTPDEARDAVIERAQNGEALSLKDVQRMIQEARDKDAEQREKQREVDAASVRKTIAELKAEAARREEIVRAEYADKIVVSPEKLAEETEKAIAAAIQPLQEQLDRAEKKLEAAEARLNGNKPGRPNVDPKVALASTGVQMALTHLVSKLDISPKAMIDVETVTAKATKQTIIDRLGKTQHEAKKAVKWLNNFISLNLGESDE